MPSLSTHEDASSQFAKREKIAAPLVKAIGTFFAVTGPMIETLYPGVSWRGHKWFWVNIAHSGEHFGHPQKIGKPKVP